MKVLYVVWELAPFFQVGGLGDVARSLPKNLYSQGIDVRVILPYYKAIKLHKLKRKEISKFYITYAGRKQKVVIYQVHFLDAKVPVYLVQNEKYLNLPLHRIYRDIFAFFDLAVVEILKNNYLNWSPDIVNCNDHHTGMIPLLIKHKNLPFKTLLTIHNLDHQGKTSTEIVKRMGIDHTKCRVMHWEIKKRQINFLLEGIIHADIVNTVSPTYAKEIMTEEYGSGLEDVMKNEASKITGILNGVDYDTRCPVNNKNIIYHYSIEKATTKYPYPVYSYIEGKKMNKSFLQEKLNLEVREDLPLIGFVGRLDSSQKGLDIMHKMIRRLNLDKYQFVILGQGDIEWVERFYWLTSFYKKNIAFIDKFDNKLASQIYAACDFLLVPSKFEPCGLIQMIAMRYGTLPIARATGGLKDSITDGIDGFLFKKYTSEDLGKALKRAIAVWRSDKTRFQKMIYSAMSKDFSWDKSAKEYIKLYNKLLTL